MNGLHESKSWTGAKGRLVVQLVDCLPSEKRININQRGRPPPPLVSCPWVFLEAHPKKGRPGRHGEPRSAFCLDGIRRNRILPLCSKRQDLQRVNLAKYLSALPVVFFAMCHARVVPGVAASMLGAFGAKATFSPGSSDGVFCCCFFGWGGVFWDGFKRRSIFVWIGNWFWDGSKCRSIFCVDGELVLGWLQREAKREIDSFWGTQPSSLQPPFRFCKGRPKLDQMGSVSSLVFLLASL